MLSIVQSDLLSTMAALVTLVMKGGELKYNVRGQRQGTDGQFSVLVSHCRLKKGQCIVNKQVLRGQTLFWHGVRQREK